MSISVQSFLVKTYVNCVKFLNEKHLLATAGNTLQVYNVSTSELLMSKTIFESERIHDIVVNNKLVLLFGGFKLALVEFIFEDQKIAINIIHQLTLDQWVQDASFFQYNSYGVLGSSNVLYCYKTENGKILLEKKYQCKEKSVLYCGKILGTSYSNAVVLCGTVFSQITIWSPVLNECNIVHRLIGHQGVIFSVTYNEGNQTICSTSDDRSVRVWQVELEHSDNIVASWKHAKITLVSSLFGHTARVWKNLQLNNGKIISIGEDGQLKVWCRDTVVHSWNTHQNGNIWSLDYNEASKLIATGGGDAGIYVWPLSHEDNISEPQEVEVTLEPDDFPRQVIIAKNMKLLIYTNNGIILSCRPNHCKQVIVDSRFKSYCILSISKLKEHFAAASISGDVLIFHSMSDKVVSEYNVGEEKIFSFHWLSETHFVLCKPRGELTILEFLPELKHIQPVHNFVLPVCRERWLTAAVLTDDLFICGDRDGSIHVYNIGTQCIMKTYHKIHSRLGVSCIEYNSCSETLMSIGRDGFLRHWEIACERNINHRDVDKKVRTYRNDKSHVKSLDKSHTDDISTIDKKCTNATSDNHVNTSDKYMSNNHSDVDNICANAKSYSHSDSYEKSNSFVHNSRRISTELSHHASSSYLKVNLYQVSVDKLPLEWPAYIYSTKDKTQIDSTSGEDHIHTTGDDTYIIGFHEVHLVIWSTREQKLIFKLPCGGGHRSWDYDFRGSQLYFSFIKQKRVYYVNVDLFHLTRPAIVQSFHRDEINALVCVRMEQQLIVSGGEDNTLRISLLTRKKTLSHSSKISSTHRTESCKTNSLLDNTDTFLKTCLVLRSHISSIRCLSYVHVGHDVYIVSGGGRAQLKIWKLSPKDKNKQGSNPNESNSRDSTVNNIRHCTASYSVSGIKSSHSSPIALDSSCSIVNSSSSFLKHSSNNIISSQDNVDSQNEKTNGSQDCSSVMNNFHSSIEDSSSSPIVNNTCRSTENLPNTTKISQDESASQHDRPSGSRGNTKFQYQCRDLFSHMLNGEDRKEKSWRLATPRINPETRYMDIALYHQNSRLYIATACSDGFIRVFRYDIETNSFSCLQELDYHGKCVLKVHIAQFEARLLLCSLSTNGDLALWDFRSLINTASQESYISKSLEHCRQKLSPSNINQKKSLELFNQKLNNSADEFKQKTWYPLANYKLHEGGVNSFDSRSVGSDLFLASGGDDCSLVLTLLNADLSVIRQVRQLRAHHSQITGVQFLDDRRFVSSSVDQRIVVWTWDEFSCQHNRHLSQKDVHINEHHPDLNRKAEKLNEQLIRLGLDNENVTKVDNIAIEEKVEKQCDAKKVLSEKDEETSTIIKRTRDEEEQSSKKIHGSVGKIGSNYRVKDSDDVEISSKRQPSQQLIRLSQMDSCIPDVHGLDVMAGDRVCVFGCGVQIVKVVDNGIDHSL